MGRRESAPGLLAAAPHPTAERSAMSFDHLEFESKTERPQRRPSAPTAPPKDAAALQKHARRLRRAGHFSAAAKLYQKAVGLNEYNYAVRVACVDSLVRAGDYEAADHASHTALDAYRQVRLFYAARALALAHGGRLDEAFPLVQVSLEGEGRTWYARCVQAELLLRQSAENRVKALTLLDEAREIAEDLWEPSFLGGWMLLDAGFPALAAGFFSEAGHADPRAAAGWLYLGDCFHALRLHDQAMFYYQKAVEIEPQHETAVARQKQCAPKIFGLTRVFRRSELRRRWDRAFEQLQHRKEPSIDDF